MFFVLKISKFCNLRCTYCYEYEDLGRREMMSLAGLRRLARSVASVYVDRGWRARLHFVVHGGEPLLAPTDYLLELDRCLREELDPAVPYVVSVQTNLTRISESTVDMLETLGWSMGVSFDVVGGERVNQAGRDSCSLVLDNLQRLVDWNALRRLQVGGISVLHVANATAAGGIFGFWQALGLSFRLLPMFSLTEPPARIRHLNISEGQVTAASSRSR
jgi:uncharacterized protein